MKVNKLILSVIVGAVFGASQSQVNGADIRIRWYNTLAFYYQGGGRILSSGTAADGDGTLLQLGYYTLATAERPFRGDWVTFASASIGDYGINTQGQFDVLTVLTGGGINAPAVGTPLAVRFFDGTTEGDSGYYNSVTRIDGLWDWVEPTDESPMITVMIEKSGSVLFQGDGFVTSEEIFRVPELSLTAMGLSALLVIAARRKRRQD